MGRLRRQPLRHARSEIDRLRAAGKAPLLELETEGAKRVKRRVEGAVTVFVTAPVEELERRLRERATESTGVIDDRLRKARASSSSEAGDFDYVVENDDRERAAEALAAIIAEQSRTVPLPWRDHDSSPHR